MSVRNWDAAIKKRTKLGLALEESAKEILTHLKGKTKPAARRSRVRDIEVEIRRRNGPPSNRRSGR